MNIKVGMAVLKERVKRLNLFHYYEKNVGAFVNLSELPMEEAISIQKKINMEKKVFASKRDEGYLTRRRQLEMLVREEFIKKGGKPERKTPYYMVVEECPWLETWYENPAFVKIPIEQFDLSTISFTYGDMFPTFSPKVTDDYEYRRTVYTYQEIKKIIEKYGLPQKKWDNPVFGQPAYVEVQVWSDMPMRV